MVAPGSSSKEEGARVCERTEVGEREDGCRGERRPDLIGWIDCECSPLGFLGGGGGLPLAVVALRRVCAPPGRGPTRPFRRGGQLGWRPLPLGRARPSGGCGSAPRSVCGQFRDEHRGPGLARRLGGRGLGRLFPAAPAHCALPPPLGVDSSQHGRPVCAQCRHVPSQTTLVHELVPGVGRHRGLRAGGKRAVCVRKSAVADLAKTGRCPVNRSQFAQVAGVGSRPFRGTRTRVPVICASPGRKIRRKSPHSDAAWGGVGWWWRLVLVVLVK
jgi:hypothetical protein